VYGDLVIPVWVELLSDRSISPLFSLYALKALGPAAMTNAIPFLRSILDKPEWGVGRLDAARDLLDLGAIEPDAAAKVYESFLSHEHERWRLEAVAGMIRVGRSSDPRIKKVLNALLDDHQADVRERARALLAKHGE
jgi:HEAT repeat protein